MASVTPHSQTGPGPEEDPRAGVGSPDPSLVIIGASARAWAASARRAGITIHAADLFADRDLLSLGEAIAIPVAEYPLGFIPVVAGFPPGPWCYTGAIENHPDLIDAIAARRPLAGNGGAAVRRVRSHSHLARVLADAGLRFPSTQTSPVGLPTDGSWLTKPAASAGGRGIAPWRGGNPRGDSVEGDGGRVWQQRIDGTPVAASFLLGSGKSRFLGASRQLSGVAAWHAKPFAYCGSIDLPPDEVADRQREAWERIGSMLEREFGLLGAVGVDAMVTSAGELVVIEINPRPTASMELVERRTGMSIAARHLATHQEPTPGVRSRCSFPPSGGAWAKGILRAGGELHIDPRVDALLSDLDGRWTRHDHWPALADLPRCGTLIPAGSPLLTVFAVADNPPTASRLLAERAAIVDRSLRAVVS